MKIYPPTYVPPIEEKPVVTAAQKIAAIDAVKMHMTENRGYDFKELLDVAQASLHADGMHMRDKEVGVWIHELNETWAWHPEPVDIEGGPKGK